MPPAEIELLGPECLSDFLRAGSLSSALTDIVALLGANLAVQHPSDDDVRAPLGPPTANQFSVQYGGRPVGVVRYRGTSRNAPVAKAAGAIASLVEHLVEREMAISDLAEEMMASYEELNLLYHLLPNIATKVNAREIGQVLAEETARALRCRRVSLLVLDEKEENLKVLAARGLPQEVYDTAIPIAQSIAGRVLSKDSGLIIANVLDRPDFLALSRGRYETGSFAIVRVPMSAHGKAIGVITATERIDEGEFTARDRKLLEGISALGASALLNCRLHAAVNTQMLSTIRALASAVDAKDHYTHDHASRVARLTMATARQLGIRDPQRCREIELAGLLHDIGKIGVPDSVLTKTSALTREEFATAKTHAQIGAGIVGHIPGLERVAEDILYHHERYDGLGYPSGLAGSAIPIGSRLICVCDVFDTLVSDRPYRKATSAEDARQEIRRCAGTQFDPTVVEAFEKVLARESESPDPAPAGTAAQLTCAPY